METNDIKIILFGAVSFWVQFGILFLIGTLRERRRKKKTSCASDWQRITKEYILPELEELLS